MDQLAIAYAPALELFEADELLPPTDAARRTGKEPRNAARDMKALDALGYIERPSSGGVVVTDKGKRLIQAVKIAAGDLAATPGLQYFRAAELRPHPLNPRKSFDQDALDEMRESILENVRKGEPGIISSLLVRPVEPEKDDLNLRAHEEGVRAWIVAGERRWRSTTTAIEDDDLPADFSMPCQVRQMTDAEHLRLAIAENLIRVDLNHVEQGEGFKALMELGGETPQTIAATVNRTDEYVRQHLRILNLPPVALDLLRRGGLPLHRALEMEREHRGAAKEIEPETPRNAASQKLSQSASSAAPDDREAPIDRDADEQPELIPAAPDEQARIEAQRAEAKERRIDEEAVDAFAAEMKEKLAKARAKGCAGWHDHKLCSIEQLAEMLIDHFAKGDPVDLANFAMFLRVRAGAIGAMGWISRLAMDRGLWLSKAPEDAPNADWRELIAAAVEAQRHMGPTSVRYRLVDAIGRVTTGHGIGGSSVQTLETSEEA